jgi:hypothetical protein
MIETISEIVLRLAREQLAAESPAESLAPLVVQQASVANLTSADLQGLPVAETNGVEFDTARTSSPDPPCPPLLRGGAVGGVASEINDQAIVSSSEGASASSPAVPFELDEQFFPQSAEVSRSLYSSLIGEQLHDSGPAVAPPTAPLVSATGERAGLFSRFAGEQRDPPYPPLLRGGAATARDEQSIVERIDEHGRRMEEVMTGLEQSLAALFASQTESLNRLRDRLLEHDRHWLEQAANRRAAFAP